jgi:hypothetical protein
MARDFAKEQAAFNSSMLRSQEAAAAPRKRKATDDLKVGDTHDNTFFTHQATAKQPAPAVKSGMMISIFFQCLHGIHWFFCRSTHILIYNTL